MASSASGNADTVICGIRIERDYRCGALRCRSASLAAVSPGSPASFSSSFVRRSSVWRISAQAGSSIRLCNWQGSSWLSYSSHGPRSSSRAQVCRGLCRPRSPPGPAPPAACPHNRREPCCARSSPGAPCAAGRRLREMTGLVPPEAEFSAPARQAGRERKNGDAHPWVALPACSRPTGGRAGVRPFTASRRGRAERVPPGGMHTV